MALGRREKEKKIIESHNIEKCYICAGKEHNDIYCKLWNNGGWEGRVKRE
jgi:hypothetical protein